PAWRRWSADESTQIARPIDFVGINYYLRLFVCDDSAAGPARARIVDRPDCPRTSTGWEIYPTGLMETLHWVKARYGDLPLYITENGAAFHDVLLPDGTINDERRVKYLDDHLRTARQAIEAGIDLRGYFVWSLFDNFEWQSGFS